MKTAELPPPPHIDEKPVPVKAGPAVTHGRSSWWVYLLIFLVVCGFGYFIYTRLIAAKASAADNQKHKRAHDLPVVVATSRRGSLDQYLIGLGTVTPLQTFTITSRVDGAIDKIAFTEGQLVKAGDLLIEIDPRPYDAALKQAQGQLAKDVAAKDSADWTVKADQEAIKDKGITEQQMHVDTATRDQDAGAIEIDQANIDAAKLNLTYSHIIAPISGRIGLRATTLNLGNIVHATDTTGLAVITQLQPITVVFTLPEDDLSQIERRMSEGAGPLEVDAYDRDLTKKLASGTLLAIDNMIDPTTGTVKIKAQFDNTKNEMYPSQFVNARMLVNTIRNAVLVPSAAIQHSPSSTFVYVVKAEPAAQKDDNSPEPKKAGSTTRESGGGGGGIHGTVAEREVTVGASQAAVGSDGEDTTVVLSGLAPGETVVTDGVDKLEDGTKVIARPAPKKATTQASATQESATTQPAHRRRKPVVDNGANNQ